MSEGSGMNRVNLLLAPLALAAIVGFGAFFLTGIPANETAPAPKPNAGKTTMSTMTSKNTTMTAEQMKMMVKNAPINGTAVATESGQAVLVKVDTGYAPNVIQVKKGVPLTITFDRQSTFKCSRKVQFPALSSVMTLLPDHGKATVIVPVPNEAGQTVDFMCGMKMLKGKIVTVD